MPTPPRPTEPSVVDGGNLITIGSADSVGIANYLEKTNWRRRTRDREGRREGWIKFQPYADTAVTQQYRPFTDGTKLRLAVQLRRPNGELAFVVASATTIKRFNLTTKAWDTIGTGFSPSGYRWQWVTINGYLILNNGIDLPVSFRVEENTVVPIYELREIGIASARFIEEVNGFLHLANIAEIKADQLNSVMNGPSPYGIVTDQTKLNYIPFAVAWGEFGEPRNWAPVYTVEMPAAGAVITLPFPSNTFIAGQTRVAVLNAGPNGGVLGGQTAYPDGILVTDVAGANITLEVTTDASLTYPRTIQVLRWEDQSSLTGMVRLQDDASPIIGYKKLNANVVVYRSTMIMVGRYTGVPDQVFDFKRRHVGKLVPMYPDAIALVDDMHVYPGLGGRFYAFDGVGPNPVIHKFLDAARNTLFDGATATTDVWSIDNPLTKEIFFCRPGRTVAFDYEYNTVSTIDAEFDACAFITKPGSLDEWFVLSIAGNLFTYGRVKLVNSEILTFLRDGVFAEAWLRFGYNNFGSNISEKIINQVVARLGSSEQNVALKLSLWATEDAHITPKLQVEDICFGPAYKWDLFYLNVLFQEELRIVNKAQDGEEVPDADVTYTGRIVTRGPVNSMGITRTNPGAWQ